MDDAIGGGLLSRATTSCPLLPPLLTSWRRPVATAPMANNDALTLWKTTPTKDPTPHEKSGGNRGSWVEEDGKR